MSNIITLPHDAPPSPVHIPDLRQELRIEPSAPLATGAPAWTLFDPVRHLFFQLGKIEHIIFTLWAGRRIEDMGASLAAQGLDPQQVDNAFARVVDFSLHNQLTVTQMGDSVATFTSQRAAQKKEWWRWMVDNYLFFRIPVVRPAAFLERTLPRVAPLYSRQAFWIFAALAMIGFYLVSRQWDQFLVSFNYFFSWQGAFAYLIGLSVVKIIHELGHAYTATKYGARVASMGVSFLVMMPVLYTDTSAAWRLRSRQQRLAIDCAGVGAELMVATVATLLWAFLPEGVTRSIFFVLATSSWIMSLTVNLSPFMRYDGYYILADMLAVPNLQQRAFALGKWRMRELLFGLDEPPPEELPVRLRRLLIVYAWATSIYRLMLFIGIALLVYHMFFKLIGIILFAVEIAVFVARPFWMELREWFRRRDNILGSNRGRLVAFSLFALVLLACLPLDRHISAPAILTPMDAQQVVAGDASIIVRVAVVNGQNVKAGDIIAELEAPDIDAYSKQRGARAAGLEAQLSGAVASNHDDLSNRMVIERELAAERDAIAGANRRRARLVLRAPVDGIVADIDPAIQAGRWLSGSEPIARVIKPGVYDVQAYIEEGDNFRLLQGSFGRFVPDDVMRGSRPVKLVERANSAIQFLDQPMLASTNGGGVAINIDSEKRLKPRDVLYRARFLAAVDTKTDTSIIQPQTGRVVINVAATSWLGNMARNVMRIIRRESSLS